MEPIQDKLRLPTKQRKDLEIIEGFLSFLNLERPSKGLRPISPARLNFLLQHLDAWDKSIFLASCLEKSNPSSFFWYSLKIKK